MAMNISMDDIRALRTVCRWVQNQAWFGKVDRNICAEFGDCDQLVKEMSRLSMILGKAELERGHSGNDERKETDTMDGGKDSVEETIEKSVDGFPRDEIQLHELLSRLGKTRLFLEGMKSDIAGRMCRLKESETEITKKTDMEEVFSNGIRRGQHDRLEGKLDKIGVLIGDIQFTIRRIGECISYGVFDGIGDTDGSGRDV